MNLTFKKALEITQSSDAKYYVKDNLMFADGITTCYSILGDGGLFLTTLKVRPCHRSDSLQRQEIETAIGRLTQVYKPYSLAIVATGATKTEKVGPYLKVVEKLSLSIAQKETIMNNLPLTNRPTQYKMSVTDRIQANPEPAQAVTPPTKSKER